MAVQKELKSTEEVKPTPDPSGEEDVKPSSTPSSPGGVGSVPTSNRKQFQLFFEIDKNCKQNIHNLNSLTQELSTQYNRNLIIITTDTAVAFRAAQNYLVQNKIPARALDLNSLSRSNLFFEVSFSLLSLL